MRKSIEQLIWLSVLCLLVLLAYEVHSGFGPIAKTELCLIVLLTTLGLAIPVIRRSHRQRRDLRNYYAMIKVWQHDRRVYEAALRTPPERRTPEQVAKIMGYELDNCR